ncbi:uncharacterized protein F4807DRAFT_413790 [Annulohypoxylon truncatum]|uniref:uncharacterized protein n=1 Tax=Annulohypoxylon truncatum TaxID=327061 RepID=UPI002008E57D|nr:uncharacterized protein F4807DRAFT_413790 [Annulohypoxylon truncatum]KAI1212625.1 hypothetical protein F4807DRAFT_413790 [Annulohypoxylon truncatum]
MSTGSGDEPKPSVAETTGSEFTDNTTSSPSTPTTTSTTPTSSSPAVQIPVLTPPFNPAPSCTQDIYYVVDQDLSCVDGNGSTVACRQFHLGPTTSTSVCFPTSWSPSSGAYISPGGCPSGYTVACAYTEEPERTATCCPSGYSCQTLSEGFPWFTTDLCVQSMPDSITYQYTTRTPGKNPETSTTTGGGTLNAFGIAIRWHLSDLATATATTTPIVSAPVITTTNPTFDDLSSGAKAGIGVGAAIAGILALVGTFLLWRRCRRRRLGRPAVMYEPQFVEHYQPTKVPSELAGNNERNTSWSIPPSTDHTERAELPGRSLPAELGPGRD